MDALFVGRCRGRGATVRARVIAVQTTQLVQMRRKNAQQCKATEEKQCSHHHKYRCIHILIKYGFWLKGQGLNFLSYSVFRGEGKGINIWRCMYTHQSCGGSKWIHGYLTAQQLIWAKTRSESDGWVCVILKGDRHEITNRQNVALSLIPAIIVMNSWSCSVRLLASLNCSNRGIG